MGNQERRAATRAGIQLPVEVEVIGQPLGLDEDLVGDPIERAAFPVHMRGEKLQGTIRDISVNGARIASDRFPHILSRVALRFELPGHGPVHGVALVMWRRTVRHETIVDGQRISREAGFGLVFESLALKARIAIATLAGEGEGP